MKIISMICFLMVSHGYATVIDFEAAKREDANEPFFSLSYSEDGYQLSSLDSGFLSVGTVDPRFTGSTSLFARYIPAGIILTRENGGYFNIISIDLAYLNYLPDSPSSISFCGQKEEPGICAVQQKFSLLLQPGSQTFIFSEDFSNLTSLLWYQGIDANGSFGPTHQFDNLVVQEVSEPGNTSLLILAGVCSLIWMTKRRHTNNVLPA